MEEPSVTETWYECPQCGHRSDPGDRAAVCPVCGTAMKNIAVRQE